MIGSCLWDDREENPPGAAGDPGVACMRVGSDGFSSGLPADIGSGTAETEKDVTGFRQSSELCWRIHSGRFDESAQTPGDRTRGATGCLVQFGDQFVPQPDRPAEEATADIRERSRRSSSTPMAEIREEQEAVAQQQLAEIAERRARARAAKAGES